VTLKEVRSFLPRINCKIANKKLGDIFQNVRQELSCDEFSSLYYKLLFNEEVVGLFVA
jgi:phosphatidylinositol phospholipase C, gamma-1